MDVSARPDVEEVDPGAPVGPGAWRDPGGLALDVPPGWSGRAGGRPNLLLSLVHEDTGVRLEVSAWPRTGHPSPRQRAGCAAFFVDRGSYRAVPLLKDAVAASCQPDDPTAPIVTGWYGLAGEREIHVELLLPPGRAVLGRQIATPLLEGLTTW